MQAMNGSFRLRGRLIGCCTALALALTALVLAPVTSASAATTTYLAIGDSISYGYTQERFNSNFPTESPSFFEEGPVNGFNKLLAKPTEVGKGITAVNYACPGETTNGLIGENEALGGKPSTSNDKRLGDYHPCSYHNQSGLPLHTSLGSKSQLEEALAVLKGGKPNHPVHAITINVGGNDELAAIAQCKEEVTIEFTNTGKSKYGTTPEEAVLNCVGFTAVNVTFPHIVSNLEKIIGALVSTGPGGGAYTGPIILEGYYNPQSFELPGSDSLQINLNTQLEEKVVPKFANATFANPFPVFNKGGEAKPTTEKKSIAKYTEMCNPNVQKPETGKDPGCEGDIHPSLAGAKALAKVVNAAYLANPAKF
jgi:lysophospholipase L1-like esterase